MNEFRKLELNALKSLLVEAKAKKEALRKEYGALAEDYAQKFNELLKELCPNHTLNVYTRGINETLSTLEENHRCYNANGDEFEIEIANPYGNRYKPSFRIDIYANDVSYNKGSSCNEFSYSGDYECLKVLTTIIDNRQTVIDFALDYDKSVLSNFNNTCSDVSNIEYLLDCKEKEIQESEAKRYIDVGNIIRLEGISRYDKFPSTFIIEKICPKKVYIKELSCYSNYNPLTDEGRDEPIRVVSYDYMKTKAYDYDVIVKMLIQKDGYLLTRDSEHNLESKTKLDITQFEETE